MPDPDPDPDPDPGAFPLQTTHDLIGGGFGRRLLACLAPNNCFALDTCPIVIVLGHRHPTQGGPTGRVIRHPIAALQLLEPRPRHAWTWTCHQRCQPLHKLQRRHCQARGAVAPGCLELQHHLARGTTLHRLVGQGRAGDGEVQLLERLALVSAAVHDRVQAETLHIGAQVLLEFRLPRHRALQRQHLLSGMRSARVGLRPVSPEGKGNDCLCPETSA